MAEYKQACIRCGRLIARDARFCPGCGSHAPFGYQCPSCLHTVKKEDMVCEGCGRPLHIQCPHCRQTTFVQDSCEVCGYSLMVKCSNRRCQELQFFENEKCTACGKKIKRT